MHTHYTVPQAHYMEPYVIDTVIEGASATRAGTQRSATRSRRCRPRAQQHHGRLWEGLSLLAERVEAAGAGDAAAAAGGGSDGAEAARELLWWLRCLAVYNRVCHEEAPPLLLQTGRPGGARGGGGDDDGGVIEVVDLVSEEEEDGEGGGAGGVDIEGFLLENGWALVKAKEGAGGPLVGGVRVKREKAA